MAVGGVCLFAYVVGRRIGVAIGWVAGLTVTDAVLFCASILLTALAAAYTAGWRARGSHEADLRRARMMRSTSVAAPAPAAGRRDASLPTVYGKPAAPQGGPRVATDTIGMPAPQYTDAPRPPAGGWPENRTRTGMCLVGSSAAERLAEVPGAMGCFWCPHAAPDDKGIGWVWFATTYGVCPCCADRRRATS